MHFVRAFMFGSYLCFVFVKAFWKSQTVYNDYIGLSTLFCFSFTSLTNDLFSAYIKTLYRLLDGRKYVYMHFAISLTCMLYEFGYVALLHMLLNCF